MADLMQQGLAAIAEQGGGDIALLRDVDPHIAVGRIVGECGCTRRAGRIIAEDDLSGIGIARSNTSEGDVGHVRPGLQRQLGRGDLGPGKPAESASVVGHRRWRRIAKRIGDRRCHPEHVLPVPGIGPACNLRTRLIDDVGRFAISVRPATHGIDDRRRREIAFRFLRRIETYPVGTAVRQFRRETRVQHCAPLVTPQKCLSEQGYGPISDSTATASAVVGRCGFGVFAGRKWFGSVHFRRQGNRYW